MADALEEIRKGDNVRIDSRQIEASAADVGRWRSSTTRQDTAAAPAK